MAQGHQGRTAEKRSLQEEAGEDSLEMDAVAMSSMAYAPHGAKGTS